MRRKVIAVTVSAGLALGVGCGSNAGEAPGGEEPEASSGGSASTPPLIAPGDDVLGSTPFAECASSSQGATPTPANLLFVLDRSGSMNCNPPDGDAELAAACRLNPERVDPSQPSKWEVVDAALRTSLQSLAGRSHVRVGLSVFPKPDLDNECSVSGTPDVPVAPLTDQQLSSLSDFIRAVEPQGRTPIAGAAITSYQHLSERLRAGELDGNTVVVLLTDGTETCDGPEVVERFITEDVTKALAFDMRTFVIGAPGSEDARAMLSEVAWAGQTAQGSECQHGGNDAWVGDCHLDTTVSLDFAGDLSRALAQITDDSALSCVFELPNETDDGQPLAVDIRKVNVLFTSSTGAAEPIAQDATKPCAEGADGWQYTTDFSRIVLCGPSCDRVKADAGGEVRVVLGCPTETILK